MARRNTFGTIRQLPSGRWQARLTASSGQVPAPGTFPTRKAASDWLARQQADRSRGLVFDPDAGRELFKDYAGAWLEQRPGLGPRTVELYDGLLRNHIGPTFGDVRLDAIRPGSVRAWNSTLRRTASPSVAAKAYRLLKTIMKTAEADELIARNPCVIAGAGQHNAAERTPPTLDQLARLVDAIDPRWKMLLQLAAWSGLRWGELVGLTRERVDVVNGRLPVELALIQLGRSWHLGPPKTAAGVRTVHLPRTITLGLEAHLAWFVGPEPDAFVFTGKKGGPMMRSNFYEVWNKVRIEAGCPELHFHDLRHLASTMAATTGASTKELMRRMGHASPRAALIYQHATSERDAEIAQALEAMMPKPRAWGSDAG